MDNDTNFLGAVLFWFYIVAALCFTLLVIHTLWSVQLGRNVSEIEKRNTWIFSALAGISFTTLSFNMLNVLTQSFNIWSQRRSEHDLDSLLSSIWKWSLTSTLFRDFGEAVVENNARYLWSQAALLETFAVSVFMGIEGARHKIPRLWAFFGLSQILPISFAQNLFYVALLRSSSSIPRGNISKETHRLLRVLTVAYCCSLIILPTACRSPWLMPLVLFTRILLFAPFLVSQSTRLQESQDKRGPDASKNTSSLRALIAIPASASMLLQIYIAFGENLGWREIGLAVLEHPAVSSLGFDMILSLISAVTWIEMQPRQRVKVS